MGTSIGRTSNADLGSILAVFAHPDDEAYTCGGLMAHTADAGRRVVCVTATRGELGFAEDDPRSIEERKALREAELEACLEVLGVTEHLWLDYEDGGCNAVPDEDAAARVAAIIDDVQPDTVITFGPDGGTLHEDHISVGRWTTLAHRAASASPRLLYVANTPEWAAMFNEMLDIDTVMMVDGVTPPTTPIDELAVWFVAEGDLAERKAKALRLQVSQTAGMVDQIGVDGYTRLVQDETFRAPRPDDWPI